MLKLSIHPRWHLHKDDSAHPLHQLLSLLRAIDEERSILAGANRLGVSYRHAWGLIRRARKEFGAPVLDMSRGRRAILSALGEKLVAADRRIEARIAPLLDSFASELEAEIDRLRPGVTPSLRVHASHGYAIELMRKFLLRREIAIDLRYRGSMEALASLAGGSCDVAGFHAPLGPLEAEVLGFYAQWLDPARHVLIRLAVRRQGIMAAAGNPKGIATFADLARPGVRFVNRQIGSGTRLLLELLLKRERVDSAAIEGYATGEFTHSGVAACIASGMADAGFGVEAGARQYGLDFIPVVNERYFLICARSAQGASTVRAMREILSSPQFRAEAGRLPGIDVTDAGEILTVSEAFPRTPAPGPRRTAARVAAAT